jgi:8-oxo-dGTP diphosphatase
VLETLSESTRRWTHGVLPAAEPYLRTGEILIVHVVGAGKKSRVTAVEHHRPVRRPAAV